ncbi:SDR family NAD(P)-dependent oxidoreductase [Nesterenkonia halobia]|uniref:SDR family oxidoreductase n=1 Tax=Nesterenkonia halobia TaxID=37922 RepID=A0ABP6RB87_9MICC
MTETIVITGASDGVGAAAARQLAGDGHRLVLVGRSPEKTRAVAESVGAEHHLADFTRLDDVRSLAEALRRDCGRIDVLAHNAGGVFSGPSATPDGFEKTFQVNHLAPFLLTRRLQDRLLDSRARVVATSSIGARVFSRLDLDDIQTWERFTANRAYGNAKLANILFVRELHDRFHAEGLSAVAFHPGFVATNFASDTSSWFRLAYRSALRRMFSTPEEGGRRLARLITGTPGRTWSSGEYCGSDLQIARTAVAGHDPEVARRHWELSEQLLAG